MKRINLKTRFALILAGAAAALITACSSTEPQIVVVTATSTATLEVVATSAATPVVELTVKAAAPAATSGVVELPAPAATPAPQEEKVEAGTLLQNGDDEIFYVTEAGRRQHIRDEGTFLAFRFARQDIIPVGEEALATVPLAGELTRLVYDDRDRLYWVAEGRRWPVDAWKKVVERADYAGIQPTRLDRSLETRLALEAGLSDGMLLQAGDAIYYFNRNSLIPVPGGVGSEVAVLDVPAEMLGAYSQQTQLEAVTARLKADTPAANVRRGPSLEAEVMGTLQNTAEIVAQGRSSDKHWLKISYQGQPGWLATDLAVDSVALRLLPVIEAVPTVADVPEAEPAAMVESSTPQPLFCTLVPIRGFGKVWSEHPEVKNTLGCADSWQNGEQATQAAVQIFQNGLMVWLQADGYYSGDPVYVFFADGSYQRFGDLGPADPAKVGTIPTGFYAVGDEFSKVYWEGTGAQVKERLGYAIGPASDSAGAFQQFSNGRMFWTETIDRIFVIYEYGYFEGQTYIMVHTWHSYEDTF
ncbi:MAG: SH3 domain-containing protein [Anaerolineales bacterium]|nr:SH3 domain-containing protein [Anaerolineales bacterium]